MGRKEWPGVDATLSEDAGSRIVSADFGIESPWLVDRVELALKEGQIHVYLKHSETGEWRCPECDSVCRLYDHQPER